VSNKTLRDEIAMRAMPEILRDHIISDQLVPSEIARDAYIIADAMIKERSKGDHGPIFSKATKEEADLWDAQEARKYAE